MDSRASTLRSEGNDKFKAGNFAGALVAYTRALEIEPENAPLLSNRAAALTKLDSLDDAINDLERAEQLQPTYVPVLCRLAFLKLYMGDAPGSLKEYVKAFRVSSKQPHQLERFKSQLRDAVHLAEDRCRQQGYTQDYIDSIVPDDVRVVLASYESLGQPRGSHATVAVQEGENSALRASANPAQPAANLAAAVGNESPFTRIFRRTTTRQGPPAANAAADPAEPTIIESPNGFQASFTVGPGQATNLMDMIGQITGAGAGAETAAAPAAAAPAAGTGPDEFVDARAEPAEEPAGSDTTGPQAEPAREEQSEQSGAPPAATPADQPIYATRVAHHSTTTVPPPESIEEIDSPAVRAREASERARRINEAVHNFVAQRNSNGEPMSGADFARGMASTIAGAVGNAIATAANAAGNVPPAATAAGEAAHAAQPTFLQNPLVQGAVNVLRNAATTINNASNENRANHASSSGNGNGNGNSNDSMPDQMDLD